MSRWAFLAGLAVLTWAAYGGLSSVDLKSEDIHTFWQDGVSLSEGKNFYARTLASDMRSNQERYPTYLPAFYLLEAAAHRTGARGFEAWIAFWRPLCAVLHFLIAAFLFFEITRRSHWLAGAAAAVFWTVNRWPLYVVNVAQIDLLAILPLLLSLAFLPTRRVTAFLLLGLSLSVKHMAAPLVPLYLIWDRKRPLNALGWILLIPVLLALPFFLTEPSGFTRSMLLSLTRAADNFHFGVPAAFDSRLPMFLLWGAVLALAYRGLLGIYAGALLLLTIFIDLSPVLFKQYMAWVVPLLPLALFVRGGDPAGALITRGMAAVAAVLAVTLFVSLPRPPAPGSVTLERMSAPEMGSAVSKVRDGFLVDAALLQAIIALERGDMAAARTALAGQGKGTYEQVPAGQWAAHCSGPARSLLLKTKGSGCD